MLRLKPRIDLKKEVGGWTPEPLFQEKLTIENFSLFLAGIEAHHDLYGSVTGSAVDIDSTPSDRAWYEFVERATIVEAIHSKHDEFPLFTLQGQNVGRALAKSEIFPESTSNKYQFAKSNGVALHGTWEEACRRAAYELIERHLILSSWVGLVRPLVTMEGAARSPLKNLRQIYEVKRVHFGTQAVSAFRNPITVSGVALLPRSENHPLILGFGAGENSAESLRKAESEALQRLAFLWGEEIPESMPDFTPTNLYHQEFHLLREQRDNIEGWLAGAFFRGLSGTQNTLGKNLKIEFVDFTRFHDLDLKIARAICPEVIPLVFGRWREREFANLPESLLIHPIA